MFVRVERKQRSPVSPPLVLIVDDVADNREMYADYLRFAGLRVATASSAEEGLAAAAAEAPAVVVMDLALPGMDGWEATKRLKAMHPRIRVIAVTGHVLPEHEDRARAAGADAFYTKPLLPSELLSGVSAFLPDAPRQTTSTRRRA